MDGILNILKPPGMTSFDVTAHLRGMLGTRKIGHAGTLDPLAVGVLPVCVGRATRAIEFLMDKDKQYRAEMTLGVVTDTQDSSGNVLRSVTPECSDSEIEAAVASFAGKYLQLPPMYSALKVDGKRLYELAREGIEIERQKREVEVYSISVLGINRSEGVKVLFDVHCSKGTYIRTLCADIGDRLGCGGTMSFLLRRRAGPFDIKQAVTLEELSELRREGTVDEAILGVDTVLSNLPAFTLNADAEKKFGNGMRIPFPDGLLSSESDSQKDEEQLVRVYEAAGNFIALGETRKDGERMMLKVRKFFR